MTSYDRMMTMYAVRGFHNLMVFGDTSHLSRDDKRNLVALMLDISNWLGDTSRDGAAIREGIEKYSAQISATYDIKKCSVR